MAESLILMVTEGVNKRYVRNTGTGWYEGYKQNVEVYLNEGQVCGSMVSCRRKSIGTGAVISPD